MRYWIGGLFVYRGPVENSLYRCWIDWSPALNECEPVT